MLKKQATQTSQLAPMARRKIACQDGVMAFDVPKRITSAAYVDDLKVSPYPVMRATTKRQPARLPQKAAVGCQYMRYRKEVLEKVCVCEVSFRICVLDVGS